MYKLLIWSRLLSSVPLCIFHPAHVDMKKLLKLHCNFGQEIKVYGYLLWAGKASPFPQKKQTGRYFTCCDGRQRIARFDTRCGVLSEVSRTISPKPLNMKTDENAVCEGTTSVVDCLALAVMCRWLRKSSLVLTWYVCMYILGIWCVVQPSSDTLACKIDDFPECLWNVFRECKHKASDEQYLYMVCFTAPMHVL